MAIIWERANLMVSRGRLEVQVKVDGEIVEGRGIEVGGFENDKATLTVVTEDGSQYYVRLDDETLKEVC